MDVLKATIEPILSLVLFAGIIIYIIIESNKRESTHYDEMQLIIRATGYRIGFFVNLIGLFVMGFLIENIDNFTKHVSPSFCMMAVEFVGIDAFVVYCIFKDAFYSFGQNIKSYIFLCIVVIVINGYVSVSKILDGTFMEGGKITFSNSGGLLCAGSFLVILISLIIKEFFCKKEVDE